MMDSKELLFEIYDDVVELYVSKLPFITEEYQSNIIFVLHSCCSLTAAGVSYHFPLTLPVSDYGTEFLEDMPRKSRRVIFSPIQFKGFKEYIGKLDSDLFSKNSR